MQQKFANLHCDGDSQIRYFGSKTQIFLLQKNDHENGCDMKKQKDKVIIDMAQTPDLQVAEDVVNSETSTMPQSAAQTSELQVSANDNGTSVKTATETGTKPTKTAQRTQKRKKEHRLLHSEKFQGFLFVLPWLLGFCVFVAYPIIQTLIFSFSDVQIRPGGIDSTPVGFKHYIYALLTDASFTEALGNYAMEIVLYVPVITVVSLILAMLLNSKVKGTGFFRTIFFLPVIITSGPVIKIFIDQGVATFPGVEKLINFAELAQTLPQFLVDALQFLTSEFIMILWFSGIQILVFMTGLQKMDKSMYEAAKIDGATSWEIFWKITLPALNPTIVLNVVFTVVMQSIFSLNPIIMKIQNDMNGSGDGAGYGYASAMAWIYFVIMIAILGLSVLIFKKHERRVRR